LNGSVAVLLLGPPVLAFSASMLAPERWRLRLPLMAAGVLSTLVMLALYLSPVHDVFAKDDATSVTSRELMWSNTARAIDQTLPVGTGVGSFRQLYPHYEEAGLIKSTFTSHAHNDYLETALESGVPGLVLLIVFLAWWVLRAHWIWRSRLPDCYPQAATIASAALLLHSIVDYPLRTAALSSVMAACLAMMAQLRLRDGSASDELWPTRHLVD
jgi:O-antigen ligase